MMVIKSAFLVCVPLFILLTGYLMNKKTLSKNYYHGIVKTLCIYVLASITCLFFKYAYFKTPMTPLHAIGMILDFSAADYSWYIEMYIGLFMLIPFLNLIYNNLPSRKQKKALIITFLFLTSIPCVVNIFNFSVPGWWQHPAISQQHRQLLPFWWKGIYQITYYFIGCYLYEFKIKINRWINVLLFCGITIVYGTFIYYYNYGGQFIDDIYQADGALPIVILSALLFIFLTNINFEKFSSHGKSILQKLSDLCLGAYLVSGIFDQLFYRKLDASVVFTQRINYYIITVPLIFLSSLALSFIINLFYKAIKFTIHNVSTKISKANDL